jgi:hypothetical protein
MIKHPPNEQNDKSFLFYSFAADPVKRFIGTFSSRQMETTTA